MRLAGVQFLSVAYWWLLRKPDGVDLAAIPLTAWAAGVPLFAFGQVIASRLHARFQTDVPVTLASRGHVNSVQQKRCTTARLSMPFVSCMLCSG